MPNTPKVDVVKEARELLSRATPRWEQSQLAPAYVISLAGDDHEVIASFGEYKENGELDHEFKNTVNNMALAIRAPELLASLCDEVERLREKVTELSTCDVCERSATNRSCQLHGRRL